MPRHVFVNGRYLRFAEAAVHVEDRGLQFADSVYEVIAVGEGALLDIVPHLDRLDRSLGELDITPPMSRRALRVVIDEVVRRERLVEGLVYLQVTRGTAPRGHAFPKPERRPTLIVMARPLPAELQADRRSHGISVISVPETRWKRVDIKTTGLLGNVLARQAAVEAGSHEAWFVDDHGYVTEGSSSNAWIVTSAGALMTPPTDGRILKGITREVIRRGAESRGLVLSERAFTVAEAQNAAEAFITSAGNRVTPVVSIDGTAIGDGAPGPVAKLMRECFDGWSEREYVG